MPDAASSNTLLGLLGPMAVLAVLALNAMLFWSRRHSFTDALRGRGFATQVRVSGHPGRLLAAGANVVALGQRSAVNRAVPPLREPAARLAA